MRAKGVTVRIADFAEVEVEERQEEEPQLSQPPFGELLSVGGLGTSPDNQGFESKDTAITAAILDKYASSYPEEYGFACCDFIILGEMSATPVVGQTTHIITYYGWALYQKCNISEHGIEDLGAIHLPLALTFELDERGYRLTDYWEPDPGSNFVSNVRDKFPSDIAEDGIDSQKYVIQQKQSCYKQAVQFSGLDTSTVIAGLLDDICNPATASDSELGLSSNPGDYILAHPTEYRELIYFGEYTLRYCLKRFEGGDETSLKGKIMAHVCEDLLQTEDVIPVNAGTAATGQSWYDALRAHAGNMVEPYLD